jgi:hypothetical protein
MAPADVQRLYPNAKPLQAGLPLEYKDDCEAPVLVSGETLPALFHFETGKLARVTVLLIDGLAASKEEHAAFEKSMAAQSDAMASMQQRVSSDTAKMNADTTFSVEQIKAARSEQERDGVSRASDVRSASLDRDAQAAIDESARAVESAKHLEEIEVIYVRRKDAVGRLAQYFKYRDALATRYGRPQKESSAFVDSQLSDADALISALARGASAMTVWRSKPLLVTLSVSKDRCALDYEDPAIVAKEAAKTKAGKKAAAAAEAKGL